MVNLFMMKEKRASASLGWNILYFSFLKVKANIYNSSIYKEQYIEDHDHSLFSCFQRVFLWLLPCHQNERSSNHLKENRKRMVICPTRTRGSSSQIVRETLKCSCLRKIVVWGSSLMHSPSFPFSISMSSSLTRNVNERQPKWQWCWWWWLLKWVKRAYALCECQFRFSGHTNTLFDDAQRVEGTRQKYNSWPPEPDPYPSCLPSRHSYF